MGLFSRNYDRPGPGVSKNEPEKKPFFRFFELFGRNFWKLMVVNLWTVLLSLPVVTIGLAQAGLTYVTRMIARDRHHFGTSDFFETVKKNWKQALPMGIIDLVTAAVLVFDLYFFMRQRSVFGVIGFGISMVVAILFIFSGFYRYSLMITFTLKLGKIYRNSFLLAISGLKRNFLTALILFVLYALLFVIAWFGGFFALPILLLLFIGIIPALRSYIIQFICFPMVVKFMIEPYYKEHPDDDIEKRRELGLLPPAEKDDDTDWGEK